jgi:hypothetical protein
VSPARASAAAARSAVSSASDPWSCATADASRSADRVAASACSSAAPARSRTSSSARVVAPVKALKARYDRQPRTPASAAEPPAATSRNPSEIQAASAIAQS